MPMTKDDLIARHIGKQTIDCVKDGTVRRNMQIRSVAARRMDDGTVRIQADVWSGIWDDPMFTVDLKDIVYEETRPPLRAPFALALDDGGNRHWLYEAMDKQTPVRINTYSSRNIHGWRVVGVTIDRWPDGRFAIGAECRTDNCPHSIVHAAVWQVKIDKEVECYGERGTSDRAAGSGADVACVAG